jgi:putative ABC transport system substrate-binding protein
VIRRALELLAVPGAIEAAREGTRRIPIVAPSLGSDPVESGLIASFARPGEMFGLKADAEGGGLMSYAPSSVDMFRRAASYVDRILKGARPGDLPVEQPTRYELVVNVKTAKTLGVTLPASFRLLADVVIER